MPHTKTDIVITLLINKLNSNTEVANGFCCIPFSCKALKTGAFWVMWTWCFLKVNSVQRPEKWHFLAHVLTAYSLLVCWAAQQQAVLHRIQRNSECKIQCR